MIMEGKFTDGVKVLVYEKTKVKLATLPYASPAF
jgi:hypothetical protein